MSTPRAINLLRAFAALWVAISFPLHYLFSRGMVTYFSHSESDKGYATAGSHPLVLVWAVCSVALFTILLTIDTPGTPAGVPSRWRRLFARFIDLCFSAATLGSFATAVELWIEGSRTGMYHWHFERNYSVSSDQIGFVLVPIVMALMFLYFVLPLTKGKQTLGYFIMRLRLCPPFGTSGAFTFRSAIRRIWLEVFGGLSGAIDSEGRTWCDRETNCTVMLIKYK